NQVPDTTEHADIRAQPPQELRRSTRPVVRERIPGAKLDSGQRLCDVLQHEERAADDRVAVHEDRSLALQLQTAFGIARKARRELLELRWIEPAAGEASRPLPARNQRLQ